MGFTVTDPTAKLLEGVSTPHLHSPFTTSPQFTAAWPGSTSHPRQPLAQATVFLLPWPFLATEEEEQVPDLMGPWLISPHSWDHSSWLRLASGSWCWSCLGVWAWCWSALSLPPSLHTFSGWSHHARAALPSAGTHLQVQASSGGSRGSSIIQPIASAALLTWGLPFWTQLPLYYFGEPGTSPLSPPLCCLTPALQFLWENSACFFVIFCWLCLRSL